MKESICFFVCSFVLCEYSCYKPTKDHFLHFYDVIFLGTQLMTVILKKYRKDRSKADLINEVFERVGP